MEYLVYIVTWNLVFCLLTLFTFSFQFDHEWTNSCWTDMLCLESSNFICNLISSQIQKKLEMHSFFNFKLFFSDCNRWQSLFNQLDFIVSIFNININNNNDFKLMILLQWFIYEIWMCRKAYDANNWNAPATRVEDMRAEDISLYERKSNKFNEDMALTFYWRNSKIIEDSVLINGLYLLFLQLYRTNWLTHVSCSENIHTQHHGLDCLLL